MWAICVDRFASKNTTNYILLITHDSLFIIEGNFNYGPQSFYPHVSFPVERRNVNSFRVKPFNYHYLISESGEFANLFIL